MPANQPLRRCEICQSTDAVHTSGNTVQAIRLCADCRAEDRRLESIYGVRFKRKEDKGGAK